MYANSPSFRHGRSPPPQQPPVPPPPQHSPNLAALHNLQNLGTALLQNMPFQQNPNLINFPVQNPNFPIQNPNLLDPTLHPQFHIQQNFASRSVPPPSLPHLPSNNLIPQPWPSLLLLQDGQNRKELLEKTERAVEKVWRELLAARESVSALKVMQLVVSTMQVDSWGLLGFRPEEVPSLQRLVSIEGKINSLIHCFVGIRRITTLYDLEVQICMNEGIRQFEELELGPLHQYALAIHYFLVKPNAEGVFKITADEIILDLSEFMDIRKQWSIDADEFLDFVAKKRSIKEKEMLGVRIQSLGMHVSFIREAKGSENESLKKSRELLCKKNSVSVVIKKDLRERSSSISQRIDSFLSMHTEFCGKHIRFASSSSEGESDNNLNDEGRCSSLKFPSYNTNGSDRISSCPYPSATEEISRLGLKSETCGHSSAGGSSMNRKRKQPSKDKRKSVNPSCSDSLAQPCKLLKGDAGSQNIQSNENNARSMEKTSESDMILSYNPLKTFISTWKEACKQQNVVQVLEGMLQFYNPSDQKKGTRRAEKIKSMFSAYPFIGLLNVAVTSIKYGMWDNIHDAFQAFTQHDGASTVKCPDFEIIDVEEGDKGTEFISVTSTQQKCCMAVEDIVTKITRYCELNNQLPTDCKLPVEDNLTSLRKLQGCEMWLVKQFNVKDFNSLGHGAFLTFLEKHASLLAASLENLLSGGKNSPLEVSMVQQQLIALVAQASNCIWDGESISKEMISSLLKRQFPLLGFKFIENGPLDNFLEMVDNLKTNVISKRVLYSATLFKNCAVGDQLFDKRESASLATGVEISLPRTISLQSVTSKDAIEVLLRAPMLSDLTSWSSWDVKFAPSLGPLVDWLLEEINSTELFCLVTRDGNVIKIDQSATTDSFLEAAIQKSPFQTAVKLLSVLSLAGGEKHAPLSLLKLYACHAFQEILKNYVDTGVIQDSEDETWQEKNVKTMNQGVNVASRFVLDCLMYMPSEFCDFAADVLLSGMQSVVRHASLAILSECNERERLMLYKIGLSSGIEDWINPCHASCSNMANMSGSSQHTCSEAKRHELSKCLTYVKNFCGEIAKFSSEDGDINYKIDSSVTSGERIDNLCSGEASDAENVDAADVVESIRRDEFGLEPSLSWMECCMLKKHHARLGRALHCLSQGLYSQDSHFLLELVQNADDNIYPQDVEPTLLFILRDSGIVILNNEQGFSAQNIRALCDVGNSTKKGSRGGYIGQKGIGFKSVFRITDAPEIHSNGFHIKFDVSEGQIGFVLPTIVPPCNIDLFSRLLADASKMDSLSWRTCILLPFRSKFSKKTAMEMFLDLHPSLLLFLHRLQCIIFRNMLNDSLIVMRKETLRDGIVRVSCGEDKMTWLVASQKLHGHDSRPKVKTTEIAIAFTLELLDDGTYVPRLEQQPVFSFLPLRNYGLKFIVQADFILPSSREEVDKNDAWNQWLLTKFPALFVSAEKLFCNLPCFRECTGKAVAAYMSFVPLVGEVQGFFSGLPRAIIMELQRQPCLLVEGDNSKMVTPCDLVRGWNEEARRVLPDGLLQELLGLGFLDRNIILSDSIARALGVPEYGAEILIKFMVALCRKQNGVESMGISWLSSWLSCLYTMLLSSSGKTEILEKLHCIPFIPLSDGTYSSIDAGAIWLHSDASSGGLDGVVQGLEVFPLLYAKLRTVSPLLLTASDIDRVVAENIILMLLQVGVRQLSAHEIMKINVLPALLDNKNTTLDEVLMCEYVCFVMIHLQSRCPHCPAERKNIVSELEIRAFIMTNYGFKSPKETAIHFSKEFGNPVDIHKLVDVGNMDWPEVDTIYLRHPSNRLLLSAVVKWREFFLEFGVTDFVQVSLVDKSVTDLSINALKNVREKDIISTLTVAKDWDSPELSHLLRLVLMSGNKECAKYVLEVLDILWDESFSDKTMGYYSSNPNVDKISFKSTFMNIICDIEWVASSMDGMLHCPKDLFYDCDAVRSILGASAPYALPKVRSQKLVSDIGFKTAVDVSDVLDILKVKGKSDTAFQASMKEMSDLYMFLWKENTASKTKLLEDKMPFIFVPYNTGSTYQELVYGVFLTSEEVCWHDPTGCSDLLKDAYPKSSLKVRSRHPLRKTLCNIYPGLRDFFVDKCGVHENPSLRGYLDILRCLSSTTLAIQAGSAVFQVLLKWTEGLKSGLLCSEDITYLRECLREKKYRVLPTVQYRWVSMHSYFGVVCWCNDEELWQRYKSSDNLHILFFGNFGAEQQNVTQSKVSLFLQKMGIPALSEVIIREPVFYGVRSSGSKTLLINWALPYAQRYLYSLHLEKYMQHKQSGFDCIMQLQVAVVAKLFYKTRVQGCKNTYNERFKCDCLLQDNTLYSTLDSDLHALFLELSRLFFDGKPELHIANFLHVISTLVESGSSEDQIEFFVSNSQKVPKLPDEETVWSLSSIDRLTNELVEGGNPLTGKDVLAKGRDPSTKKDEKFSKLNKPRMSSNWPPSNWKMAPDSDYALVNGFETQAAVLRSTNRSGKIKEELSSYIVSDQAVVVVSDHANVVISDQADELPFHLDAEWEIEENTTSISLKSKDGESYLGDVCKQTTDVDRALQPAGFQPLSEGSALSSLRSHGGNQDNEAATNEAILTGKLGEHVAFEYLTGKYGKESVRWVNEDYETGLPYDIIIGDEESNREYVEVKATRYARKDWFTISMREWQFAVEKAESFSIMHVVLSGDKNARVTIFKNPAKLCQLRQLQLVIMMHSNENS